MPRVFLSHKPYSTATRQYDFSDLGRFGKVVIMANRAIYPDNANERVADIAAVMRSLLEDFHAPDDYLCLAGDPVLMGVAAIEASAMALAAGYKVLRLLKWDRKLRSYYRVDLPLPVWYIGGSDVGLH